MASTKFYLDCRRTKPGIPSVIKIAIGHGDKTSYISLDAKVLQSQWDQTRGRILNHPEKQVLNAYIYETKQVVDAHIIDLTRNGRIKDMTATDIRDYVMAELKPETKKQKEDETLFITRFMKFIELKKASTKESQSS